LLTRPAVHYAPGEVSNVGELQRAASSDGFKHVIADDDRIWGGRVTPSGPRQIRAINGDDLEGSHTICA
jgi:hypothetical protein